MEQWEATQVATWIEQIGFPEFKNIFIGMGAFIKLCDLTCLLLPIPLSGMDSLTPINSLEQEITGDVLIHADHDLLRELGFHSVGQRISFLKILYEYKINHGMPIGPDDYIPESVLKGHRVDSRVCVLK